MFLALLFHNFFINHKKNIRAFKWPILKMLVFLQVNPVNSTLLNKICLVKIKLRVLDRKVTSHKDKLFHEIILSFTQNLTPKVMSFQSGKTIFFRVTFLHIFWYLFYSKRTIGSIYFCLIMLPKLCFLSYLSCWTTKIRRQKLKILIN